VKRFARLLKPLVSALFLAALFTLVPWPELRQTLRQVSPPYLLLTVLLGFLMVAASCWKWWYLLRLQGHPVAFGTLYRWYFIGYFYSNFLPSNVGGDVARAWLAGRRTGAPAAALLSVFAERLTGMIFLLTLAALTPLGGGALGRHPALWIPALAAAGGLLLLALLALGARLFRAAARARWRTWRAGRATDDPKVRWAEWGIRKWTALDARAGALADVLRRRPSATVAVFALTALFYLLTVANVALTYRACGVWPDAAGVARVLPAALMVAMLPITMGNIGLAEGAYVFYFGLIGQVPAVTLAMGLILRLKVLLLGLVGMLFQWREPVFTRETKNG